MNMVKLYDKVMDEKTFLKNAKAALLGGDTGSFNEGHIEDIKGAFMGFLNENYPSGDIFFFTDEDRLNRVEEFIDEIFSYLNYEDYEVLEVQA